MTQPRLILLLATASALAAVFWNDMVGNSSAGSHPAAAGAKQHDINRPLQANAVTPPAVVASTNIPVTKLAKSETAEKANTAFANPLSGQPIAQFDEIVRRPLFSTTRRPPQPKPIIRRKPVIAKPAPPREPPLRLTLVGIVSNNGKPIALVRDRLSKTTLRVARGDKVQGWKVQNIAGASVSVRHKQWTRELKLFAN